MIGEITNLGIEEITKLAIGEITKPGIEEITNIGIGEPIGRVIINLGTIRIREINIRILIRTEEGGSLEGTQGNADLDREAPQSNSIDREEHRQRRRVR